MIRSQCDACDRRSVYSERLEELRAVAYSFRVLHDHTNTASARAVGDFDPSAAGDCKMTSRLIRMSRAQLSTFVIVKDANESTQVSTIC